MADLLKLDALLEELTPYKASLVAVSKTKPVSEIREVYNHGHFHFGENYVQEAVEKAEQLPSDIRWHFIGHMQSNKAKLIAPFIHLVHGIDSLNTLNEINMQAQLNSRVIEVLIQVHIASEESKYGVPPEMVPGFMNELNKLNLSHVSIRGFMGMATFTDDEDVVRREFRQLRHLFEEHRCSADPSRKETFKILSMGMSSDYRIALDEGSTMIRVGSIIFGQRH